MPLRFKDAGPVVSLPNDADVFLHDGASGTRVTTWSNLRAALVGGVSGGLVYLGTIAGVSVPLTAAAAGYFYFISTAGTSHGKSWKTGDLAIYRGTSGNWDQVTLAQSDSSILALAASSAYSITSGATYVDGVLTSATVTWADGSSGVYTATSINSEFGTVDAYTVTHVNAGVTVTQAAVTRNADGQVTAQPSLTIS